MHWFMLHARSYEAKILTLHGFLFVFGIVLDVILTLLGCYWVFRHERRVAMAQGATSFPTFLAFLLPKKVFFHKSAWLDYQVFLLRRVVGFPLSLPGVIGITTLAAVLTAHPNYSVFADNQQAGTLAVLLCGMCLVVAIDFSNFSGHFLQHKVGFFWEFHKVHHAAEVLTPATLDRTHPVEDVPKLLISSALFVVIFMAFALFRRIDILGTLAIGFDLLLITRALTFGRLRHSHIPMFFPGWATTVFFSPVHHHTHHSSLERHFDSNYGQNLIIWDRMFGTLVAPEHPRNLRLGLSHAEHVPLNKSILHLYWLPIRNAWNRMVHGVQTYPAASDDRIAAIMPASAAGSD